MLELKIMSNKELREMIDAATEELFVRLSPSSGASKDFRASPRGELIQDAKNLLESLKNADGVYSTKGGYACFAKFNVNKKKRFVICTLIGHKPYLKRKRAIAKCHPDDVFNEDIGRLISLMMCMDKEIPEKFLNAPQPESAEAGHVVEVEFRYHKNTTKMKFKVDGIGTDGGGNAVLYDKYGSQVYEKNAKIIDDSDVIYTPSKLLDLGIRFDRPFF